LIRARGGGSRVPHDRIVRRASAGTSARSDVVLPGGLIRPHAAIRARKCFGADDKMPVARCVSTDFGEVRGLGGVGALRRLPLTIWR